MRVRLVGLVAALALIMAGCTADSSGENGALASAIGVRGAWTIDVINPDGTVAEHLEFTNDLLPSGAAILASILVGGDTPGPWSVWFDARTDEDSPCPAASVCQIIEPDLVAERIGDVLRLSGSYEATADGIVEFVQSNVFTCGGNTAPIDCPVSGLGIRAFTSTDLPAPPSVSAGQTVQVEVEISFGTLP